MKEAYPSFAARWIYPLAALGLIALIMWPGLTRAIWSPLFG